MGTEHAIFRRYRVWIYYASIGPPCFQLGIIATSAREAADIAAQSGIRSIVGDFVVRASESDTLPP